MNKQYDAIIIGGGAAGLFCASTAAMWGKSVAVLEHNDSLGKKILISGGGRCNFTNEKVTWKDYQSSNPHFVKSALAKYSSQDFISLVENHQIPYYEKKLGQLFCENKAVDILNLLIKECENVSVDIITNITVDSIEKKGNFKLKTSKAEFQCEQLVIATGGLSIKNLGATAFGYEIAKQFGHSLIETSPALVPLTTQGFEELSGVSLPVEISIKDRVIADDLLFTHKGTSGPIILKASLFWFPKDHMIINFLPNISLGTEIENIKNRKGNQSLKKFLGQYFPKRFVEHWLQEICNINKDDISNLSKQEIENITLNFHQYKFEPSGTEGYKKAEVTRGGVCTDDISQKTMESKLVENLFFVGEVMDVTGLLGGYNFQWAWSSAYAAGEAIAYKG